VFVTWWGARRFPSSAVIVILGVVAAAPLVVTLIAVLTRGRWFPAGDMAQAELHMRGFFGHPPLVGAAGRIVSDSGIQGSHPGPSLWIAMLPVYLIGGRSSGALMAAVVSVHLASMALALRIAWKRYGTSFATGLALLFIVIVRSSGPDFVFEPWNPWLAIFPLALFVLLIDRCLEPETQRRWLVGAVVVGSHCVQCHAGYAILVAAGLSAVAWKWIRTRGSSSLAWPVATLVVMWIPPLVDQWRRQPGNLSILWQHFGSPSEPRLPLADAMRAIATQFNLLGPLLWGPGGTHPAESWFRWIGFVGFLAMVGIAYTTARRLGFRNECRLLILLMGGFVVAAFSISRLFGPYFEYTIRWAWILAGLVLLTCLTILVRAWLPRSEDERRRSHLAVAGAVLLVASTWSSVATAADVHVPGPTDSAIIDGLAPQVSVLPKDSMYLVRFWDPYTLNATGFGLVLELERRGYTVRVDPTFAAAALPHRTAIEAEVDRVLWVVVGPRNTQAAADATLEQVGYFDPRDAAERQEAEVLLGEIEKGLRDAGRDELVSSLTSPGASLLFAEPPLPDEVAEDLRTLYRLGQPVGVYLVSPGVSVPSLG